MDKSLVTLLHFWGVFQFTQVQPLLSPHKQCWMSVSRIFSEFQVFIGWGGGRTARRFRKGCTVLRGNWEMPEKYEYCSIVPRTFYHTKHYTCSWLQHVWFNNFRQSPENWLSKVNSSCYKTDIKIWQLYIQCTCTYSNWMPIRLSIKCK